MGFHGICGFSPWECMGFNGISLVYATTFPFHFVFCEPHKCRFCELLNLAFSIMFFNLGIWVILPLVYSPRCNPQKSHLLH